MIQIAPEHSAELSLKLDPQAITLEQDSPSELAEKLPLASEGKLEASQDQWGYGGFAAKGDHFGDDDRRKGFGRFDSTKGKPLPRYQKLNQSAQHINQWPERRREPFDGEFHDQKR